MATKYYIGGLRKGQKAPKWSSTSRSWGKVPKDTLQAGMFDVQSMNLSKKVKNPKTKLIQQEDAYGCAVACLAMALGKTYKQMRSEVQEYWDAFRSFDHYHGLDATDEKILLFMNGYRALSCILPGANKKELKRYIGKTPALMTVPSINVPGAFHGLYWDGFRMFDPSKKKVYSESMAWEKARGIRMLVPRTRATLFGIDSSPPAEST